MEWEFKNGIPIYQQLIQGLSIRIANGTYPPAARFPPSGSWLEREELLAARRTNGRFVTEDGERLERLREELAAGFVSEFCARLRKLGMDDRQILGSVQKALGT